MGLGLALVRVGDGLAIVVVRHTIPVDIQSILADIDVVRDLTDSVDCSTMTIEKLHETETIQSRNTTGTFDSYPICSN